MYVAVARSHITCSYSSTSNILFSIFTESKEMVEEDEVRKILSPLAMGDNNTVVRKKRKRMPMFMEGGGGGGIGIPLSLPPGS